MPEFTRFFILRASLSLSLTLVLVSSVKAARKTSIGQQAAVARIEKIVVQGNVVTNPGDQYVKVIRAASGSAEAGQVGSVLYGQDQLKTGDATVVLTYLGDESGQSKLIVRRNGSVVVQMKSAFLNWGRVWIKARGAFTIRTNYWVLGVPGTDFHFTFEDSETPTSRDTAKLEVTSGAVNVSVARVSSANTSVSRASRRRRARGVVQAKSRTLRVWSGQGVNLVEGENIPATPYQLSVERLNELNNWIKRIEAAQSHEEPSRRPAPVPTPEVVPLILSNYTSLPFLYIYMTSNRETSWGTDKLGKDILDSNNSVTLQMDSSARLSLWDLKVVAGRGFTFEWDGLEFADRIIFTYQNGTFYAGERPPSRAKRFLTLSNETPFTIDRVYLTPAGEKRWGKDVLGNKRLESGRETQIAVGLQETSADWDLKIVFPNGDSREWRKMKLGNLFNIKLAYSRQRIEAIPR